MYGLGIEKEAARGLFVLLGDSCCVRLFAHHNVLIGIQKNYHHTLVCEIEHALLVHQFSASENFFV